MNLQTIIFIGRSGSGKGTQATLLDEFIKINDEEGQNGSARSVFHLESGKLVRAFTQNGADAEGAGPDETYSRRRSRALNEIGGLQPEFLSIWAWGGELIRNLDEAEHLLIDGTPRREIEAQVLESAFSFYERPKVDIVYINVSTEWATERLRERGRHDDIEASDVAERMRWFDEDVSGVIDYYRKHDRHHFHEINGEQSIDDVHSDIMSALGLK